MRISLNLSRLLGALLSAATVALVASGPVHGAATITIVNVDGPGEGFNDPTVVPPVGGNPGTTLGQQRINAFQHAANIWGQTLDSPAPIFIQSSFDPLPCTATGATLGAAGSLVYAFNTPGVEIPEIWYHIALVNKLAGEDLVPNPSPVPGLPSDDIVAFFNTDLDNPVCLGSRGWYYGLDNNHGTNIDLVTVLLHEFGHGLGFANRVTEQTGARPSDRGDIFAQYQYDITTNETWNQMTQAERAASAVNDRKVAWNGLNVTLAVPSALAPGSPALVVSAPASIAGSYPVGTAAFGPALTVAGVTAPVVRALDEANPTGPTTFDGCTALTNAAAVAGNIALVDRGTCGFAIKAQVAEQAGAVGVIIANVAPGSAPGMGNSVPPLTIGIPAVSLSLADGDKLRNNLPSPGVTASLRLDPNVRSGATAGGLALIFAPNPVQAGSSGSHWDPIAFPNQLMEPAINADLTHSVTLPEDMTTQQMIDIGWFSDQDGVPDGRDECIGSDPSATVVIDGCDSGVPNTVSVLGTNGCKISDLVADCAADAGNHEEFVTCVAHLGNRLMKSGVINGVQKGALQSCASEADIP